MSEGGGVPGSTQHSDRPTHSSMENRQRHAVPAQSGSKQTHQAVITLPDSLMAVRHKWREQRGGEGCGVGATEISMKSMTTWRAKEMKRRRRVWKGRGDRCNTTLAKATDESETEKRPIDRSERHRFKENRNRSRGVEGEGRRRRGGTGENKPLKRAARQKITGREPFSDILAKPKKSIKQETNYSHRSIVYSLVKRWWGGVGRGWVTG